MHLQQVISAWHLSGPRHGRIVSSSYLRCVSVIVIVIANDYVIVKCSIAITICDYGRPNWSHRNVELVTSKSKTKDTDRRSSSSCVDWWYSRPLGSRIEKYERLLISNVLWSSGNQNQIASTLTITKVHHHYGRRGAPTCA